MSALAIVTVITRNYAPQAQALALSIKQHDPEATFAVCFVDDPGPDFRPPREWDYCFLARDLSIPAWRRFAFQYTPFELACALKPYAIRHLLNQGSDHALYLDADMQIYRPLSDLRGWLDRSSVVLTPHIFTRPFAPIQSLEQNVQRLGIFNAGMVGARRCDEAHEFLNWWSERVATHCMEDVMGGYYVDQKFLDLAPALFPDLHISRHGSYNAGHWTLPQAACTRSPTGEVLIDNQPLAIFHFSGFSPDSPQIVSRFASQYTTSEVPALARICNDYAERLRHCTAKVAAPETCEFACLSDGTRINPLWREAIRSGYPSLADIDDPFDVARTPNLLRRLARTEKTVRRNRLDWRWQARIGPLRRLGKAVETFVKQLRQRAA